MRILAVALLLLVAVVPVGGAAPRALPLESCTLTGGIAARCGTFSVPEDRDRPEGRSITLRVAVVPARDGGSLADPLVYLAGGPGGSAVESVTFARSTFWEVNATRDLVLVDQRGTGGSNALTCATPRKPLATVAEVQAFVRACLARTGADVRWYTTAPAMDDLADVIRALGYSTVNVYGGSYGATAAQYLLVQHPELVRTAILDGGTLLDVPILELWGRNGDRALRAVLGRCAHTPRCARAYPRVRSEAFELIAALRRKPVRVGGSTITVAAAASALQALSRSPSAAGQIPWIAHEARAGSWAPLQVAIESTAGGAEPQLMYWSIVCQEPWARHDPARTAAASKGTYLAESTGYDVRLRQAVCSAMPPLPQPSWSAARPVSDKPILFLAGGADPQDPPANVAGAATTMPNSRTIVLPAGGHGVVQLGCMPRLARQFVDAGTAGGLDPSCLRQYTPPAFFVER